MHKTKTVQVKARETTMTNVKINIKVSHTISSHNVWEKSLILLNI